MKNEVSAKKGLKSLFAAEVFALISLVASFLLLLFAEKGLVLAIFALITLVALLIFEFIAIIGLYKLGKIKKQFLEAFTLTVALILASIIMSGLHNILPNLFTNNGLSSIVTIVFEIIIGTNIIKGCIELLQDAKCEAEVQFGKTTYVVFLVGNIAGIVLAYLGTCDLSSTAQTVFAVLGVAVSVIYELFYIAFLGKTIKKVK